MKKSILWYQPEIINNEDIIIVNGQEITSGSESNGYFNELKSLSDKAARHKSPWCGNFSGTFFVKGHFDAEDEKGRKLAFMFLTNEKDGVSELLKTVDGLGYQLTPKTKECLSKKDLNLNRSVALAIAILVAIVFFVVLIN